MDMWGLQVYGHVGPTDVWTCGAMLTCRAYRCVDTWGLQVCGHVGPTGVWTCGAYR